MIRTASSVLCCLLLSSCSARAADLLPPDTSIPEAIDTYIDAKLGTSAQAAVAEASPGTILRRITLDLAGRIPTTAEYDWYLQLPEAQRRVQLVDRLMSMPDFDLHLRNCLDELLLPNKPYDAEFRDYLLWAVQQNRPWHEIFRDVMVARNDGPEKGAAQFLKSRVRQLDDMTNDTAVLFFGVNISCAKCHDHPLVTDWKQDHFYGMQAFFNRTFATKKQILTEKPFGEVLFKTTEGEEKPATFMFLTGATVEDRTPSFSEEDRKQLEQQMRKLEKEDNPGYILFPSFSPRQELVELAKKDDQQQFLAKNLANRTWARLLGTGIVDPPDQMHSGNAPSHPELLDWLARDIVNHDYDLRRIIRGIVLSDTYARTSEWTSAEQPPAATDFALAATRPLTPRQLSASLLIAASNPEQWAAMDSPEAWAKQRQNLENQAEGWSRLFEQPGENFQVAVDEALFFSNNDRIQNDLLRDSGDRLISVLKSASDEDVTELLWKTVLNRTATSEEKQTVVEWLGREQAERLENVRSLTWALLAGPEIRFNH